MWPEIIPTIIICTVLAAAVTLAVISIFKDKKKGKSCGCGCGCSGCSMSGACPSKQKLDDKIQSNDNSSDKD